MANGQTHEQSIRALKARFRLSIAIEESIAEALVKGAMLLRSQGDEHASREIEMQLRRYRVGVIKQRAIMAAHGIEI